MSHKNKDTIRTVREEALSKGRLDLLTSDSRRVGNEQMLFEALIDWKTVY